MSDPDAKATKFFDDLGDRPSEDIEVKTLNYFTFTIEPKECADECRLKFQLIISKAWSIAAASNIWLFNPRPAREWTVPGWKGKGLLYDLATITKS
ncbi:hypothetical protein OZ411_15180 [Bradyrhizobium sp. Arg237L]|uniref:hypothetical protein n=1 Tax=Bradyrhizobium sp. Arg237L TaxID=3003352 RepID=UPI00249E0BB2|nr:hypothetical protein [Bradyrhizobium sp. Arg237L]MDI4234155.1 hypothetical protein [Bradyrhizobium sp. Arg237L]